MGGSIEYMLWYMCPVRSDNGLCIPVSVNIFASINFREFDRLSYFTRIQIRVSRTLGLITVISINQQVPLALESFAHTCLLIVNKKI